MAKSKWYQLDNAAKIVPSTTGGADTRVFRITCELKEDVDPDTLQSAVAVAAREFPHFGSILKKGLFWYYLDQSGMDAEVTPDNKPALDTIYREDRRDLLYRVSYYRNRINLEMFHVLTDGTGAFEFLKAILMEYLGVKYQIEELVTETSRASSGDRQGDAFSVRKFLKAARDRKCTVAELSTALFIKAILEEMSIRESRLPIVLSIPVNLRNYFPSETARNFFGVINVAFYPAAYDGTLESIIKVVKESFVRQLRQDQVELTMNSYAALEHNIAVKVVPLPIKNLVISAINAKMQKGITGTLSNVGKISVPEEMEPHIRKFSCFMAAPEVQVCLCSYKDVLVFGVASAFVEHPVMRNFFRAMVDLEIDVELESNDYDNIPAEKEEA